MRHFRSLLIDDVKIRTPDLQVLSLAVHRHLPELASVEQHRHSWAQALLYLSGEGRQTLADDKAQITAGTLVMIPPQVGHAFLRQGKRPPLCLAVNFRLGGAMRHPAVVSSLNRSDLAQLRQSLAELHRLRAAAKSSNCEEAAKVLQILIALLKASGWLERDVRTSSGNKGQVISKMLAKMDLTAPLADMIRQCGYQRDYLNFLVKKETGLTLGQFRAQRRLDLAKRLLAEGIRVAEVAAEAGLPDQSYFARWFRRQSGQTPSEWRSGLMNARQRSSSQIPGG